jgi:segregation and condensation protein B
LFATTKQFLDDLGLTSLDQLPPLQQVSKEDMPGGMLPEIQALEAEMQGKLERAAIDAAPGENALAPAVPGTAASADNDSSTNPTRSSATDAGPEDAPPGVVPAATAQDDVTRNQHTKDSNDESASSE